MLNVHLNVVGFIIIWKENQDTLLKVRTREISET